MDHHRFDHLARALSSISSRRGAVRALGGGLIAALGAGGPEEVAAACVPAGKKCGHGRKCCRGTKCVGGKCKCAAGVPCAGTCCPGGQTCLSGRCCDGKLETCQGRQCGVAANACGQTFDCGACLGGQPCDDGTCRCPAGQKPCADGACKACCVDNDCAGNRICQNGGCRCAVGTKECDDACIPDAACCPGEARPCYTGPGGTEGVGVCRAGTQTCRENGTFGPCDGEVTPQGETCNGRDDDCDGRVDHGAPCDDPERVCQGGRCCLPRGGDCGGDRATCCSGACRFVQRPEPHFACA